MNNKKKCIYIFSASSLFNIDVISEFENFSAKDSIMLSSNLIGSFIEILSDKNLDCDIIYCLNEQDENSIPKNLFPEGTNIFFTIDNNLKASLDKLNQNYFGIHESNILFQANSIGISTQAILKIFDLLSFEDDVLVIGQSNNKKIPFIGFNSIDQNILLKMFSSDINYDEFLIEAGKNEYFIHTLHGFQLIDNFTEFKNLYIELSKKESLSYCSEQMHERFTNLFIEYKDLLK